MEAQENPGPRSVRETSSTIEAVFEKYCLSALSDEAADRWHEFDEQFRKSGHAACDQACELLAGLGFEDRAIILFHFALLYLDSVGGTSEALAARLPESDRPVLEDATIAATHEFPAIPGYTIVRRLPGMHNRQADVYEAVQNGTNRRVALKIPRIYPFSVPSDRRRFLTEIESLAELDHPNIVTILDAGRGPLPYFAMTFIDGVHLDKYLAATTRTVAERTQLFKKIAGAVDAAHQRGIVHRDLKPSNILIDEHGEPHVLDFGLSRSPTRVSDTAPGEFVGSLRWASPEQVKCELDRIDPRTDVYSIGVMLYEALTGQWPYPASENAEVVREGICYHDPIRRPTFTGRPLPRDLDTIIRKALSKEPARRYRCAGDLADDLDRYLMHQPIQARRDEMSYVLSQWARRHQVHVAAAALVLATAMIFLTLLINSWVAERRAILREREQRRLPVLRRYRPVRGAVHGRVSFPTSRGWCLPAPWDPQPSTG